MAKRVRREESGTPEEAYARGLAIRQQVSAACGLELQRRRQQQQHGTAGIDALTLHAAAPPSPAAGPSAFELFAYAAEQGHGRAMAALAQCYERGWGVNVDKASAAQWLQRAAGMGDLFAQGALCEKEAKDDARNAAARVCYEAAAAAGDPAAMEALARCGVVEDQRLWLQQAADLGHPQAMTRLACALRPVGHYDDIAHGHRPAAQKRLLEQALEWWQRAAACGDVEAMVYLGKHRRAVYDEGRENYFDADAQAWFRRADDGGEDTIAVELAEVLSPYSDSRMELAHYDAVVAVDWLRRAARRGHADASYWLGLCYASGEGIPVSNAEAAEWFRTAAEAGNAPAMVALALCYYRSGRGDARDALVQQQAVHWAAAAARAGHADGAFRLGEFYFYGGGCVERNAATAVAHFREAVALSGGEKHAAACAALGRCLLNGWGVEAADPAEGLRLILHAATLGSAYARGFAGAYGLRPEEDPLVAFSVGATQYADPAAMVGLGWYLQAMAAEQPNDSASKRLQRRTEAWYKQAASLGDPEGLVRLGECYERNGDWPAAERCYREAATAFADATARRKLSGSGDSGGPSVHRSSGVGGAGAGGGTLLPTTFRSGYGSSWLRSWVIQNACETEMVETLRSGYGLDDPYVVALALTKEARHNRHLEDSVIGRLHYLAAALGHADAMAELGHWYLAGCDRRRYDEPRAKDSTSGRLWLERSTAAGSAKGMWYLGAHLEKGDEDVAADLDGAVVWYTRAAERGSVEAMVDLGILLHRRLRRTEESLRWLRAAAETGDTNGMWHLALVLRSPGAGQAKDYDESVRWLRTAADAGDTDAALRLGNIFLHGDHTRQDGPAAVACYMLVLAGVPFLANTHAEGAAANTGMGMCYQYGMGVDVDVAQAGLRFTEACRLGSEGVCLGKAYELGLGSTSVDHAKAIAIYAQLADEDNNGDALFCLGQLHSADPPRAIGYYQRAVACGFLYAQIVLDLELGRTTGVGCGKQTNP